MKQMKMAYAIGLATCGESKIIDLGKINSEWDGYKMSYNRHGDSNDSYGIYYCGPFGKEKDNFNRIAMMAEGWKINHMVAMFIQIIEMHKNEMKKP